MKNTIKILKTIILSIVTSAFSLGQSTINGQIKENDNPVSFANVLLLNPTDSSLVKGAVTDSEGNFKIEIRKAGNYMVKTTSIGYKTEFSTIQVSSNDKNIDLGTLVMEENTHQLDEVVINAKKPMFEQKIDRTVMNVQSSITASSGSALDILEKAPGVTIDRANNALSMGGKQGVRIMINGKMSRMPLPAVVQMLDGINAENVGSVELITTPPAKYEAEGNAGIINIVLKQTTDEGTNGSISVFAGYGIEEKTGGNLNFNHRNKKINIFGNYSYRLNNTKGLIENHRTLVDLNGEETTTTTFSHRDPSTYTHNGRLGLDYQINDRTIIGMNGSIYDNKWEMDAENDITVVIGGVPSYRIDLDNHEINSTKYYVGNINFSHDFNNTNNLSIEFDYIKYDSDNPTDYTQIANDINGNNSILGNREIKSSKVTPLSTWVPRLDYSININNNISFEAGLKGAFNTLENDVNVTYIENGVSTTDPDLTRNISMTEDIFAGYVSLNFTATSSVKVKAGLRYEHTITNLDSEVQQNVVYRNFGNFFPSIFINKTINDDNSWVLSYSRRVTRPTFNDIAPFVIFLDPNSFWTGNESLLPAITDAVKAEYRYKSYLFTLQYSRDNDAIARFQPRISADGETQLSSAENMNFIDSFSFATSLPFSVTDWWEMQYNLIGTYAITETSHLDTPVRVINANLQINGSNIIKLPKEFTFEISGGYQSPGYWGIMKIKTGIIINLGMEKKLANDNGSIKISFSDMFNERYFQWETIVPEENIDANLRYKFEGQIFNLSYSKNFGNNKLKKLRNKKTSSREELQRIQ